VSLSLIVVLTWLSLSSSFLEALCEKCRHESERMLDELQAAYDEAELRIGEIRRDISDFRREVMAEAAERGAKTASSEHVLKY
jgi:C4-dicarboxylate-specific signal transduction histidine kinase